MSVIRSAGLRGFRDDRRGARAATPRRTPRRPVCRSRRWTPTTCWCPTWRWPRSSRSPRASSTGPTSGCSSPAGRTSACSAPLALAIQNSPDARRRARVHVAVPLRARAVAQPQPGPRPVRRPGRGGAALRHWRRATWRRCRAPTSGSGSCTGPSSRWWTSATGCAPWSCPTGRRRRWTVYEEFFGVPVRVARPAAMLRVPSGLAGRSLAGGDPSIRRLALAFLDQQAAESGPNLVPKVRGRSSSPSAPRPPTSSRSPGCSRMHPRTLQRRLADEGTDVRRDPRRGAPAAGPSLPDHHRHAAQPGRGAASASPSSRR